ncbi:unnamed protein product [Ambrosiozyma monospora]|uniref:Unnamed protein product n=1 Tax=Ambrosiozyma monospora TaxID=43982 RepID=A0A9W7DEG2_AMBMO|nr:unnamed protein product [Ambrosiozyma monospora]
MKYTPMADDSANAVLKINVVLAALDMHLTNNPTNPFNLHTVTISPRRSRRKARGNGNGSISSATASANKQETQVLSKNSSNSTHTTRTDSLNNIIEESHNDSNLDGYSDDVDIDYGDEEEDDTEFEAEYSFDFDFDDSSTIYFDTEKFHLALFKYLQIYKSSPTLDENEQTTDDDTSEFMSKEDNKKLESQRMEQHRLQEESEQEKNRLWKLFSSLSTLCDPYTQPSQTGPHNESILSLDLVSDLILAINYSNYTSTTKGTPTPVFDMAYDLAHIVEHILAMCHSDNETELLKVNNDETHWKESCSTWIPDHTLSGLHEFVMDYHRLRVCYAICCVSVLCIYKLYSSNKNFCLNPFISFYLQIWKNQTRVIFLGLEIDRRDEEQNFPGYPEVIRHVIKGASALRSVVALILNNEFDKRLHDLKHESLNNFMSPWGRKAGNGSLTADMRIYVAAMLALGSDLEDVTELLFNFEPEDRYDEDINYMFEVEIHGDDDDEYHLNHYGKSSDGVSTFDTTVKSPIVTNAIDNKSEHSTEDNGAFEHGDGSDDEDDVEYELHPECHCVFIEDEEHEDEQDIEDKEYHTEDKERTEPSHDNLHVSQFNKDGELLSIDNDLAVRTAASKSFKYDSEGRDWRDIPRGSNVNLTSEFIELLKASQQDPQIFLTPMAVLLKSLDEMTRSTVSDDQSEKIIRSTAWVVRYEYEASVMTDSEKEERRNDPTINVDVIYSFLSHHKNFENMIRFNPSASFCIIDELLMVEGYRRVLIWFLTHLELSQWLINYFHELLIGSRGNPDPGISDDSISARFKFSREGAIVLSEVEKSMLLHEFFSNALIYLSRGASLEIEDMEILGPSPSVDDNGTNEDNGKDDRNDISTITPDQLDGSRFITNRSNAQKLMKVICLMLKSLEEKGVLALNDSEYRIEIQTLLVQWVGVGMLPEARELFFKSNQFDIDDTNSDSRTEKDVKSKLELEKRKKLQIEMDMSGAEFFSLFGSSFEKNSYEFLMTILNLGMFYPDKKSEILPFFKDLNGVSNVFNNQLALLRVCDYLFEHLNECLINRDDKGVFQLFKLVGVADPTNEAVVSTVKEYITSLDEDKGEGNSKNDAETDDSSAENEEDRNKFGKIGSQKSNHTKKKQVSLSHSGANKRGKSKKKKSKKT